MLLYIAIILLNYLVRLYMLQWGIECALTKHVITSKRCPRQLAEPTFGHVYHQSSIQGLSSVPVLSVQDSITVRYQQRIYLRQIVILSRSVYGSRFTVHGLSDSAPDPIAFAYFDEAFILLPPQYIGIQNGFNFPFFLFINNIRSRRHQLFTRPLLIGF